MVQNPLLRTAVGSRIVAAEPLEAHMARNDLLKQARKRKKLSQEGLAKALGVTQALVSAWECGVSNPSPLSAAELVTALGVEQLEDIGYRRGERIQRTGGGP